MANSTSGALARFGRALAAVSLAFGVASAAHADNMNISSDSSASQAGLGTFVGSILYTPHMDGLNGTLLISLTNTSTAFNGGYITGFVFNFESSDLQAKAKFADGPQRFKNAANRIAGPFGGPFEAGTALRGRIMGGGHYTKGIASGATKVFEFDVKADDASLLSASDFIRGNLPFNFVVRFRGFTGGGVDLVPVEGSVIPGPSALMALALFTVLFSRRKRVHA